ncbi:MAG: hypothetical protein ACRDSL_07170 [Pseudonocardiaceae bacterium]
MAPFTVAHAQAAAERLTAEHQAIFDSLIKLEDHPGRTYLKSAVPHGVTREHSAEVQYGLETLWTLYQTYRAAVLRLQAIRARRSQPTSADLQEIEELVIGATTVILPSPDGSLQPRRRLTLNELVAEFRTAYAGIYEVVSAVDQVQIELSLRLDRCHELLSQAEAVAAALSLAADTDPVASTLPQLTERLDAMRQVTLTDPLRLWAPGGVDLVEIEQLIGRCEQAYAALGALGEPRRHAEARLDLVEATFAEVARLHRQAADLRHHAHIKIHGLPPPEPGVPWAQPPDVRLAAARQLCLHGGWRQLATELAALERDAEAALQRGRTELATAGRPLRERAELRGRLGAYRAKAAALGRIEDLALEHCYQRARDLLWTAPCDLALASAAVAEYQTAVNTTAAGRSRL